MENHADQLNREMRELLEEIRIILPGVQILGALLLTVPFTNRFTSFDSTERVIYFIGFLATAVATVLLVAPSAQHRILWRRPIKDRFLINASRLALAGTGALGVALIATLYLLGEFVFGNTLAAIVCALFFASLGWLWYGLPILECVHASQLKPSPVDAPGAPPAAVIVSGARSRSKRTGIDVR